MPKTTEERIEELKRRKTQIEARLQALLASERWQERKRDTRRKVLAGAMILHLVEAGRFPKEEFLKMMDGFLTRDADRKLFDMPALTPTEEPD